MKHELRITLRQVLERLRPGDEAWYETAAAALEAHESAATRRRIPWFVRALTAISAWIAAILLLTFILGARIVSSPEGSLFLGAALIVAAVLMQRMQERKPFLEQLAFALSLAGQTMVIYAVDDKLRHGGGGLAMMVLGIGLIVLYPDRNHRFLSTLIAIAGAAWYIHAMHISYGLQALAAGVAAAGAHVWFQESSFLSGRNEEMLRPVAYGLIAGFLFLLIPSIIPPELVSRAGMSRSWAPLSIALAGLLLLLEYRLVSSQGRRETLLAVLFGGTLCLAAASLKAPGILGALLVLATGFSRGNGVLTGLAFAFLAVFLTAFYYTLDMTLLAKSGALLASGAVLLILRLVLVQIAGAESEAGHE